MIIPARSSIHKEGSSPSRSASRPISARWPISCRGSSRPTVTSGCDPGDGLVCNDGHLGGIHLNDVATVLPIFRDGRIIAYAATMAHHLDVGGGTPGSIGIHEEHVQEGLIIPPSLLVRDDAINEELLGLILRNVRAPRETGGDFRAQLAASATGQRRVLELADSETTAGLAAGNGRDPRLHRKARPSVGRQAAPEHRDR